MRISDWSSDVCSSDLAHLAAKRRGTADATEPSGILSHHRAHDEAAWHFLAEVLQRLTRHPAVRLLPATAVFAAPPVRELQACDSSATPPARCTATNCAAPPATRAAPGCCCRCRRPCSASSSSGRSPPLLPASPYALCIAPDCVWRWATTTWR